MDTIMTNGTEFSWGWVIFLILILWFFVGGNNFFGGWGNRGGFGYGNGFIAGDALGTLQGYTLNHGASNCELERRSLVTAAETNFRIIDQAERTRDTIRAAAHSTDERIDFYAYQDLRDKLSESQRENMMLQNKLYSDAKFGAIEAQLAAISCKMAKEPDVYAVSAVSPSAAVLNGYGLNPLNNVAYGYNPYNGYNNGCGCNGNVLA